MKCLRTAKMEKVGFCLAKFHLAEEKSKLFRELHYSGKQKVRNGLGGAAGPGTY